MRIARKSWRIREIPHSLSSDELINHFIMNLSRLPLISMFPRVYHSNTLPCNLCDLGADFS